MNGLDLVVLALAVWRCASLLAYERGPYDLLLRLRHRLGVRQDSYGQALYKTTWAEGAVCVWCNSMWCAFGWTLFYGLAGKIAVWVALPFALSTVSILLEDRGIRRGD